MTLPSAPVGYYVVGRVRLCDFKRMIEAYDKDGRTGMGGFRFKFDTRLCIAEEHLVGGGRNCM